MAIHAIAGIRNIRIKKLKFGRIWGRRRSPGVISRRFGRKSRDVSRRVEEGCVQCSRKSGLAGNIDRHLTRAHKNKIFNAAAKSSKEQQLFMYAAALI
jgi:hypothetical protein